MYKLNLLPYEYYSLEPYIDTNTLAIHYNKYQKSYLDKLNSLLIQNNFDFKISIEQLVFYIGTFKDTVKNDILYNLGGVLNHAVYFRSMSPFKVSPSKKFLKEIENNFESFEDFKEKFKSIALSIRGSGYTFLVVDNTNKLRIMNFFNQDTPYYYGLLPLIGLDMWEHAYFLNYKNNKSEYIDNFFEIVDFSYANKICDDAKKR